MKVLVYCRSHIETLGIFSCTSFMSGEHVEYRRVLKAFRQNPQYHGIDHELSVVEQ